jgi:hypothetical protein
MMPAATAEELKAFIEPVYRFYAALAAGMDPLTGLGGTLLFAGELDEDGCRIVRAANVAGAASLAASSDPYAQRQAIRDGVIDFLVTSPDEALRILKNEIRKRNAVAVGVGLAPAALAGEMHERGVVPDLLSVSAAAAMADALSLGAQIVSPAALPQGCEFRVFAEPPADFTKRVLGLIPESDHATRRWLLSSARYLGPHARRARSLPCDSALAEALIGI